MEQRKYMVIFTTLTTVNMTHVLQGTRMRPTGTAGWLEGAATEWWPTAPHPPLTRWEGNSWAISSTTRLHLSSSNRGTCTCTKPHPTTGLSLPVQLPRRVTTTTEGAATTITTPRWAGPASPEETSCWSAMTPVETCIRYHATAAHHITEGED